MSKMGGLVIATLALLFVSAEAQQNVITVSAADLATAAGVTTINSKHVMRAVTAAGASYKDPAIAFSGIPPTVLLPPGGNNRFPDDLSYQGGVTVQRGQSHAIYVLNSVSGAGCNLANYAACWGNPEDFLTHLGTSEFIHITDQYVGRHNGNRYTNGANAFICCANLSNTGTSSFTDLTMQFVLVLAISAYALPTGENDIYHIFLPPGTDECFSVPGMFPCYSPDNPNTFAYCGYHSSVTINGLGHVLYSVEPYTNVPGCSVPPGTPNGMLADSTANVLSHETFETITDPEGDAWWNFFNLGSFGDEIGDECSYQILLNIGGFYNPSVFSISGKKFAVQPEYSNGSHSCATRPPDD